MATAPERLERYRDFVVQHSNADGVYDPEKGLGGLLSTLTPDPKLIVLSAMQPEAVYFTERQLYRDVLVWLENLGVPRGNFSIRYHAAWNYCERREAREKIDGSLVEIGAVVKQVDFRSAWGGERIGYVRSVAGSELAACLLPNVCGFVYRAGQSGIPYQYDSMWRLLGQVNSSTDRRRPSAVFKIANFLVENPGQHRSIDVVESLRGQIDDIVVFNILNNLGAAGIIHYDRHVQGWVINDLMSMFYDEVLLPAKKVADTLTPLSVKPLDSAKVVYFLQNYQQERSQIGLIGGAEVRERIISILIQLGKPMKLGHIAAGYNEQADRRLARDSMRRHLNSLIQEGQITKTGRGHYASVGAIGSPSL